MNILRLLGRTKCVITICATMLFFAHLQTFGAVSVNPSRGATGVSSTAQVVFTFEINMDHLETEVVFFDFANPFAGPLPVQLAWNGPYTVLTCTPMPGWPDGKQITWVIDGETLDFEKVSDMGTFTVGGGSGNGGTGTNAVTTLTVGKMHSYIQNSTTAPALDSDNQPYVFQAITALASNRTATAITVTAPTAGSYGLSPLFIAPENWLYTDWDQASLSTFEEAYPVGDYVFSLTSSSGTEPVAVSFPPTMTQPNPPRIANFAAAQAIEAAQAFTLTWDAFQGGTANDHISVSIGTNFTSPDYDQANALRGTATSVIIPAGVLQPGETFSGTIMFIRQSYQTNDVLAKGVYRATLTDFPLQTKSLGISGVAVLNGKFGFDIATPAGGTVTIESSTTLAPLSWEQVLVTNALGTAIRFVDPRPLEGKRFYRLR